MSMISSQSDKLRERAKELRDLANGPVNEGFPAREKLFGAADAMCQAADLILELRDGLQRANAENAKLRALLSDALILTGFNERQYLDKYLREEEGTTLFRELKSVGIEVDA